ncbi:MAG TPA: phage holin family protein [Lichenihabitans sp.]|nr:phage holin family protein [Lichenihabitans sp.]
MAREGMPMTNDTMGRPSTPALFADAIAKMTTLFETEIRLVRTEVGEKISTAIEAIVVLLVSAILLLTALFLVLVGVVELLVAFGLLAWQAYMLVGAVIAVIGGIALYMALRSLSAERLMPKRSLSQLGKDADIVKEQVR